jgi:hypothetical protein
VERRGAQALPAGLQGALRTLLLCLHRLGAEGDMLAQRACVAAQHNVHRVARLLWRACEEDTAES